MDVDTKFNQLVKHAFRINASVNIVAKWNDCVVRLWIDGLNQRLKSDKATVNPIAIVRLTVSPVFLIDASALPPVQKDSRSGFRRFQHAQHVASSQEHCH